MKRINGTYYSKVRFADGRRFMVRMSQEEVDERQLYWLLVVLMPFASVFLMAAAAGMI